MSIIENKYSLFVGLVVAIFLAGVIYSIRYTSIDGIKTIENEMLSTNAQKLQSESVSTQQTVARDKPMNKQAMRALMEAYSCSEPSGCPSASFLAETPEEAVWLQRYGFPTVEEFRRFNTMSADELKLIADQGNRVAKVFYGKRIAESGDKLMGSGIMSEALDQGSLYALYQKAEVYLSPGKGQDIYLSAAMLRLAHMLGDTKAPAYLYERHPYLHSNDIIVADKDANRIYGNLNKILLQDKGIELNMLFAERRPGS